MHVKFVCTYWGQEETSASHFFRKVLEEGYDGAEINLPDSTGFVKEFQVELERVRETKKNFVFIAQQVLSPQQETADEYIARMQHRLNELAALRPDFINSHTGKDYFSFDDNCWAIEAAENIALRSGIRILHETSRGRFTFHAASLLPYLDRFPHLQLTADFSHWCTVSESLLSDQQETLAKIIPYAYHLHARIGFAHAPQVNDPFGLEWKPTVDTFIGWWRKIIAVRAKTDAVFTVCPEFGPVPYMPTMPVTQQPLSDQWRTNARMKNLLRAQFGLLN
jgi:hypothetical protein